MEDNFSNEEVRVRLGVLVAEMIELGIVKSKKEFALRSGFKNIHSLMDLLNGGKRIRLEHINMICKAFPEVSSKWLQTSWGPSLIFPVEDKILREPSVEYNARIVEATTEIIHIPHFTESAQAGLAGGFMESFSVNNLPLSKVYRSHAIKEAKEPVLVDVIGDSMYPEIKNSDQLICDLIPKSEWAYLRPGIYVIVLEDQITVKRIAKNTIATGTQELTSINKLYGPASIDSNRIYSMLRILELRRTSYDTL
jgi:phage repressor protein C with HTH and peptisase S24 domain